MDLTAEEIEELLSSASSESQQQRVSSVAQKRNEVAALVRCHSISTDEACAIVGMDRDVFERAEPLPQGRIDYLPLPGEIWEEARRLRAQREIGEDDLDRGSSSFGNALLQVDKPRAERIAESVARHRADMRARSPFSF